MVRLPDFSKTARTEIPAFRLGPNLVKWQLPTGTRREVIYMDAEDRQRVLDAFKRQGVALPIYREHDEKLGAFGAVRLVETADGISQELALTQEGRELVESGKVLYDSPEVLTRRKDGRLHLEEIRSASLVTKPARAGSEPLLLSATASVARRMQELMDSIQGLGDAEKGVKTAAASGSAEEVTSLKQVASALQGAIAELRGLANKLQPAQTAQMSAAASETASHSVTEAARGGVELLRLTGATSVDHALGQIEASQAVISKLSALCVAMGVETGRLQAGEAEKYAKYPPARLAARLEGAEPVKLSAVVEKPTAVKHDPAKEDDEDLSAFDEAIGAGKIRRVK